MSDINRKSSPFQLVISSGGTNSTELNTDKWAFGSLQFPAAFTGATLAIQAQNGNSGTWAPIHDSSGAITMTVTANTCQRIPDAAFGFSKIRFVSASSEGADRVLHVQAMG